MADAPDELYELPPELARSLYAYVDAEKALVLCELGTEEWIAGHTRANEAYDAFRAQVALALLGAAPGLRLGRDGEGA